MRWCWQSKRGARPRWWTVLLLSMALAAGGCGGDGDATPDAEEDTGTAAQTSPGHEAAPSRPGPAASSDLPSGESTEGQLQLEVDRFRQENEKLRRNLGALVPKDPFIIINTTLNRMSMRKGDEYLLQDAVVSTGSNTELVDPRGKRSWFFSTPKGVHTVKRKMIAPVWVKPDWAFIEEGEPIPGPQAEARFEEGTLGKYGLYFGNGYLIHGTLFQRFLGQSVTHGCVRVGDDDLETVYKNSKVGTKIYIY